MVGKDPDPKRTVRPFLDTNLTPNGPAGGRIRRACYLSAAEFIPVRFSGKRSKPNSKEDI